MAKSTGELRREGRQKQAQVNKTLRKQGGKGEGFKNKKHVDLLSFNAGAEYQFIELVRQMINETSKGSGGAVSISNVLQEAAFELDVSTTTVKRYLTKHSARRAEFRVFGEYVMLNPRYVPPEDIFDLEDEDESGEE